MRVGEVVKVIPEKKFGFIRTEGLRQDVFFHFSVVNAGRELQAGDEVEYEVDEFARIERKEMKATLVRISPRPLTMRLKVSDAPELHSQHHPKARQKRPTWRKGSTTEKETNQDPSTEPNDDSGKE